MATRRLNPVAWSEGMFLRPQHLQQRDLFEAERLAKRLLPEGSRVVLDYRPGWTDGSGLDAALQRARNRDREQGTTTVGPHRADVIVRWDDRDSRQRVSRGQQKLLVYLLRLAQSEQWATATGEGCILLLDDLPAELDEAHRRRVLELAVEGGGQVFITALERPTVPLPAGTSSSVFHVEQGRVREVVQ